MLKTNEYIKREIAINRIRKIANMMGFENPAVAIDCTISVLENTPAADVIPARHGRWIMPLLMADGHIYAECSNCHEIRIIDDYCSACGAIMDLED